MVVVNSEASGLTRSPATYITGTALECVQIPVVLAGNSIASLHSLIVGILAALFVDLKGTRATVLVVNVLLTFIATTSIALLARPSAQGLASAASAWR